MRYLLLLTSVFSLAISHAGDIQGGGGGPQNVKIKRYLDKRIYALDGGRREVAPNIKLINACLHNRTLNTINKVWSCENDDMKGELRAVTNEQAENKKLLCGNKIKKHLSFEYADSRKRCLKSETRAITDKGLQQVCVNEHESEMVKFPLTYKMDVYRRSIGNGGLPLYPNKDHDIFVRTIKYHLPDCIDVTGD